MGLIWNISQDIENPDWYLQKVHARERIFKATCIEVMQKPGTVWISMEDFTSRMGVQTPPKYFLPRARGCLQAPTTLRTDCVSRLLHKRKSTGSPTASPQETWKGGSEVLQQQVLQGSLRDISPVADQVKLSSDICSGFSRGSRLPLSMYLLLMRMKKRRGQRKTWGICI